MQENILINDVGDACLSDLGFTSVSASRALSGLLCMRGGTTRAMAPELFNYFSEHRVDNVSRFPASRTTDVYAFGMTIYEVPWLFRRILTFRLYSIYQVVSRSTTFNDTYDPGICKRVLNGERPLRPHYGSLPHRRCHMEAHSTLLDARSCRSMLDESRPSYFNR